jgi:hypothetical protein
MQDIQKIRFLTLNYSKLQGLKGFPIGLLLLLTVLWANVQHGPARNLTLPLLFMLGSAILYWWIDRYYKMSYGRVESTTAQKRMDYFAGVIGGIAALAAFVIDTTDHLPVSLVGLVFVVVILVEYLRIRRLVKSAYSLWQMIISISIVLGASLLPLFGLKDLWQGIGLRSHLFVVLVITSIVLMVMSLVGHIYFTRQFPSEKG